LLTKPGASAKIGNGSQIEKFFGTDTVKAGVNGRRGDLRG